MKEMNGTVTLAFVEEDNKQRVIFRVFPLCTREGEMMLGNKELFPDDGSLRIVPDKREQSTFKERMREIGGLCAINLVAENMGFAFLHESGISRTPYLDQLACFTIGDPPLTCPMAIVYKKNGFLSPAARFFIDLTKEHYQRFNHSTL